MPEALQTSVTPSQILAAAGDVSAPTYLQRTGLILATAVGSLAGIVILALLGKWIFAAPSMPVLPVGADPTTTKTILENYKALQQTALEPYMTLIDSIVVKILLPVFTSILGYIFGSRSSNNQS